MLFPTKADIDALKAVWTDKLVRVKPGRADLARYESKTGRIVTITYSGRALVDFCDGAWIDVDDFQNAFEVAEDGAKYDGTVNTAQKAPVRH